MSASAEPFIGPTTVTSTVTTTRFGQQGPNVNRATPQDQGNAAQNRDVGYGAQSRNIEPQSPYANRGVTHSQGNPSKNNYTGYGTNQVTQSSSPYTNRNAPHYPGAATQGRNDGFGTANMATKSSNPHAERGNDVLSSGNARRVGDGDYQQPAMSNPYRDDFPSDTRSNEPNISVSQDGYQDLARQKSIPRKQIGISVNAPYSPVQPSTSSSPQVSHSRQQSDSKPLPSAPISINDRYGDRGTAATPQPSSILDRSRPITKGYAAPRDGQDVVNRAKSNTYDTEVIEKIAPGKPLLVVIYRIVRLMPLV